MTIDDSLHPFLQRPYILLNIAFPIHVVIFNLILRFSFTSFIRITAEKCTENLKVSPVRPYKGGILRPFGNANQLVDVHEGEQWWTRVTLETCGHFDSLFDSSLEFNLS